MQDRDKCFQELHTLDVKKVKLWNLYLSTNAKVLVAKMSRDCKRSLSAIKLFLRGSQKAICVL